MRRLMMLAAVVLALGAGPLVADAQAMSLPGAAALPALADQAGAAEQVQYRYRPYRRYYRPFGYYYRPYAYRPFYYRPYPVYRPYAYQPYPCCYSYGGYQPYGWYRPYGGYYGYRPYWGWRGWW